MSFLQRLKQKNVIPSTPADDKQEKVEVQKKAAVEAATGETDQVKVDIYKTPTAIIVHAQISGVKLDDCHVLVEGDNDIITIKGDRMNPDQLFQRADTGEREELFTECLWGKFYRQIILPVEVDPNKAEAKIKDGILEVVCPLKSVSQPGIRITVTGA